MNFRRGDILLVNLNPIIGSEQGDIRPALIIQNDIGNLYSPTIIVSPITTRNSSKRFPTDVKIPSKESGLNKESKILLNQIRTIDKSRIIKKISTLDSSIMDEVDLAIKISLDL